MIPTEMPLVSVIDDHAEARDSLAALLTAHGFSVQTFSSAGTFMTMFKPQSPSCVITDLRMDEVDGLQLLCWIKDHSPTTPVIVVSAFATVSEAVKIMKSGADTLIQKPYEDRDILDALHESRQRLKSTRNQQAETQDLNQRFASLDAEERLVLEKMIAGQPTKAIAYDLNISTRTVDRRRTSVNDKLGATSLAELAMMYVQWTSGDNFTDVST